MTDSSVQTTNRIKILFTIPNFDTAGSGKVVYDLVKHIDNTKFEPHIACAHNRGDLFNMVQALNVPIHITPITTPYKPYWSFPFRVLKLSRFLKKHHFDLIHSWHWSSDISEPLAAKLAGIPFVYTKKAMGWGNKAWRWRSQLSTHIITINSDMLNFFNGMEEKTSHISIGLDQSIFKVKEKIHQVNEYSINQDEFVIVSVANLVPIKGIEILLEAVKQLNNPKIKTFIIGDDSSNYAQKLKKKYNGEGIIFTGKQMNVKPYLDMADLFIIPTKIKGEGQPIALIEAMLSGRVVIGSAVSGIKDILKYFPDQLFQPSNSFELKNKIISIMNLSKIQKQNLEREMRNYALQNYDICKSLELHEALYTKIVTT